MELIYIYIDKYRTFEKQKISFSNRFNVNYDSENKVLSIEENEDYVNIYPDNIVNINGILGKNASGKSSLLSLIGKKIEDRHKSNEIFFELEKDPHKNLEIINSNKLNSSDTIRYKSNYFLLYYYGKDENKNHLFVFETNSPLEYIYLFENSNDWTGNQAVGNRIFYYTNKGWFSAVFKRKNENNILINDTSRYLIDYMNNEINIEKVISIINFQKSKYFNKFDVVNTNEDEYIISLKRKTVPMQNLFIKNQLHFLVEQMDSEKSHKFMYNEKEYVLSIKFAYCDFPEIESKKDESLNLQESSIYVVDNYKDFKIEGFEEWQKITLAFLNRYICYLYRETKNFFENKDNVLNKLLSMHAKSYDYEYQEIKDIYHNQIEYIFSLIDSTYINIDEFKKCENALETFLKDADKNEIKYFYKTNNLFIKIVKDIKFSFIDYFFDNFIDENLLKNIKQKDSIINDFIDVDIQWMSDGEKENLALFTSIDEQISMNPLKKNFILLFDEIERSMHPDLCRNLISNLTEFLKQYPDKEFQIIIASHSPFIAGDLLHENIVCLSRKDGKSIVSNMTEKPFAQNIHTILKSQFFLDSFIGEYARKCIDKIIKCLKYEKIDEVKNELNEFLCSDKKSEQKLIDSAEKAKKYIEYVIDSIGEPIIRKELHRRLSNAKWLSAEEKIQFYQNKIRELEESLND